MWIRSTYRVQLVSSRHILSVAVLRKSSTEYGLHAEGREVEWWLAVGSEKDCMEAFEKVALLLKEDAQ